MFQVSGGGGGGGGGGEGRSFHHVRIGLQFVDLKKNVLAV